MGNRDHLVDKTVIDKNGHARRVKVRPDGASPAKNANKAIAAPPTTQRKPNADALIEQKRAVLGRAAKQMTGAPAVEVADQEYRAALAMEREGLGSVEYKGPGLRGVFTPTRSALETGRASREQALEMLGVSEEVLDEHFTPDKIHDQAGRIYEYMSEHGAESDSASREALFTYAAESLDVDYDVLYRRWMRGTQPGS